MRALLLAVGLATSVVAPGAPDEVDPLLAPGRSWPEPVRAAFAERIRREWPADRPYGPLVAGVALELRWPLVTGMEQGALRVPVVEGERAEIEARLELPRERGPRRVVVLLDASSSANAQVRYEGTDGTIEAISALEAERRALEHLVDGMANDWLELGVIAFGESTWPIAEPGASAAELRAALARFRAERPKGEGRTDAVCALWTASEWLDATPDGVAREIVVLTDGDAPYSGRFTARDPDPNATTCPAAHHFSRSDGASDVRQLMAFGRRLGRELRVTPLVFEPERRALPWRQLAERTGGALVRAPGAGAIDAVLPALVASRITRVVARNLGTGAETGELRQADGAELRGALPLAPGANDVELAVESDRGTAALFRFRIYSAAGELERALAELRAGNRGLEVRAGELADEAQAERAEARRRALEIRPDGPPRVPAVPAAPAH